MRIETKILQRVTDFYLTSHDFNGIPTTVLSQQLEKEVNDLTRHLIALVREDRISILFPDIELNTHIKRLGEEPPDKQIEKLQRLGEFELAHVCIYPSRSHLRKVVDPSKYHDRPFTLRLAWGEPHLSFLSFDLSVLEFYRNDPRYYYENDDISGKISVRGEHYESKEMPTSDKVLLEHFGFSYNSQHYRAVAVFLRYLADLSPQHQQIWNAKILEGDYKLHPDYYKASILGVWHKGITIFDAFIEDLHHINQMSALMGRPPLFKNEFGGDQRPREFGFLIRPTLKEYNEFVHLLDKMLSENINRDFFQNEISFEYSEPRSDGQVVVRQKGTIQVLDEWLLKNYTIGDRTPINEMIAAFKEVRQQRQRPAHAIAEDVFDQKYFEQQRALLIKAYEGLRTLRVIFSGHPQARGYKYPEHLDSGTIWTE